MELCMARMVPWCRRLFQEALTLDMDISTRDEGEWLLVQPTGVLVEQLQGDPFERALAELLGDAPPQTRVQDIVDALDYASTDDRIKAVHLELSQFAGGGLSKLQRVGG